MLRMDFMGGPQHQIQLQKVRIATNVACILQQLLFPVATVKPGENHPLADRNLDIGH
jgi:hypothetical protein